MPKLTRAEERIEDQKNKQLAQLVFELIYTIPSREWIEFLFDTQNTLLRNGEFEALTELGCEMYANKFSELKLFFVEAEEIINS